MMIWLSVELAGRAKIWGSHPQFRYWTSFFSDEHASMTNISLNFTFPGFTLLENDQKCTFYVILWVNGLLGGPCRVLWGPHPQFRSSTPFSSREYALTTNISLNFTFPGFTLLENDQKRIFYVISWVYGLLGGTCRVLWGFQPKYCTWPSNFT